MKIGLLGYGYTASFFARLLVSKGHTVWGTSRDVASLQYEQATGMEIVGFNQADIEKCMLNTSCLLISIPPAESGTDPSLELLRDLIVSHKRKLNWLGYLSSTSVYGDHQGGWVDESSDCHPDSIRAKNRFFAEKAWMSLFDTEGLPVMVFRLAGIYGPGRNALERLQAGKNTTIFKEGQYFSRTHVYDICDLLYQSMLSPMSGEIFNVSDDYPCGSDEVDCYAADILHVQRPQLVPYDKAALSLMAKEFYKSNKRVSNAKLKQIYLPNLRYPTYKEGLQSILSKETIV